MDFRKTGRWLVYRFTEGTFFIFLGLVKLLPLNLFHLISTPMLKSLIFFLIPRRRIIKNLRAAFGETYSAATKKGLAKGVQEHFTRNLVDCFLQLADPEHTRQNVTVEGLENLDAALAKGKGVIALGAHIGNFVLLGTRLGMDGYPFSTLFRLPSDPRMGKLIQDYLPCFYQRVIPSRPRRSAVRQVLHRLEKNEIVLILGDNLKRGKVQTVLFGQRVFSPRGPVSLALRSGAAVIPMYLIRNYQGGLHLTIEPEIPLITNAKIVETVGSSTEQIVRHLESLIRRYPDQWNWLTVRMQGVRAGADKIKREVHDPISGAREVYNEPARDADQRIGS
jgi:KDO2-lipid IV(A) lauroyltransferase